MEELLKRFLESYLGESDIEIIGYLINGSLLDVEYSNFDGIRFYTITVWDILEFMYNNYQTINND